MKYLLQTESNEALVALTYVEVLQIADAIDGAIGTLQEMHEDPHYNGDRDELGHKLSAAIGMMSKLEEISFNYRLPQVTMTAAAQAYLRGEGPRPAPIHPHDRD